MTHILTNACRRAAVTRSVSTAFAAAITLLSAAGSAHSHATLETASAPANSTYKGVIRIGHGCNGAATHTLEVRLPDGFINAKPMPKAGWTVETDSAAYDKNYDYYGRSLTEGVRVIRWTGGPLSDSHYDEFVFRGALRGHEAGDVIAFPTVQVCTEGRHDWVEIAAPGEDPHDLDAPAPLLTITAAKTHSHGDTQANAIQATAGVASVGALVIESAWTRQPPPGAKVAGGYMAITNNGAEADRLLGGSVPFADIVEVHEMSVTDGMMRMREVDGGLEIPAGEKVMLEPGGYHVMFMGVTDAPAEGDVVPMTLLFEKAGEVSITLPVAAIGAPRLGAPKGSAGAHGGHGAHGSHSGQAGHAGHTDHNAAQHGEQSN